MCQKFVNHLLDQGYKESSFKNYTAPLKGALLKAVDLLLIQQTPFRGIVIAKSDAEEKRIKHLEEQEVNSFVETLKETERHYFTLLFTLLHTGMRKGEALDLQWSDINLENGTLHIRHTFTYDYNNLDNLRTKPKTKASYRTILLADFLVRVLKEHKLEQNKHKLKSGEKYHDHSLVFARENGLPYSKSTLQRAMTRILKKLT